MQEATTANYINRVFVNNPQVFVETCEDEYKRSIAEFTERVCAREGHTLVMLAGPSSSGKTTTASILAANLAQHGRGAVTVSLDDFYLSRDEVPLFEDGTPDFESVYALDIPMIASCLKKLDAQGECDLPIFSFQKGCREDFTRHVCIDDNDVVIVEGLHALNPVITDPLPEEDLLKLYISVSTRIYDDDGKVFLTKRDLRFIRRMVRDFKHRNSPVERTFELWKGVRKGEDRYLFPFACNADVRINTMHLYEPCVFKSVAINHLEDVPASSPYYEKACQLIEKLSAFETMSLENVPECSLLNEFLR